MSRLVTHPDALVPVASTPDGLPATAASDPHSPVPGNASGSPVGQTIAANSDVLALSDTQPCHSIAGRSDVGGRVDTTRRSACTYACACVSSSQSSSRHDPVSRSRRLKKISQRNTDGRREENGSNEPLRRIRRTRRTTPSDRKLCHVSKTAAARSSRSSQASQTRWKHGVSQSTFSARSACSSRPKSRSPRSKHCATSGLAPGILFQPAPGPPCRPGPDKARVNPQSRTTRATRTRGAVSASRWLNALDRQLVGCISYRQICR